MPEQRLRGIRLCFVAVGFVAFGLAAAALVAEGVIRVVATVTLLPYAFSNDVLDTDVGGALRPNAVTVVKLGELHYRGQVDVAGLPKRFVEFGRQQDFSVLDLRPSIEAAAARGEQPYCPIERHFNVPGNKFVGEAFADVMPDARLLDGVALASCTRRRARR